MICEKCGSYQEVGKFCGKCGVPLIAEDKAIKDENPSPLEVPKVLTAATYQHEEVNQSFEKVKKTSNQYFNYFFHYIKEPTKVVANLQLNAVNGIVSWVIFTIMFGLVAYSGVNAFLQFAAVDSWELNEVARTNFFMPVFTRAWIGAAVITGAIILIMYGIINIAIKPMNLKSIATLYGTVLLPVTLLVVITWLLTSVGSYTSALILFSFAVTLATIVCPLVIIMKVSENCITKIDRTYIGIIYFASYLISSYILYFIILESTIMKTIEYVKEITNNYF